MNKGIEPTTSLELSIRELQWLAGGFGLAQLPLPLMEHAQINMEHGLSDAQKSLCERNIIQREQGGWQVDPLAAMFIQWMLNAQANWQFCHTFREGQRSYCSLFLMDRRLLLVFVKETSCQFVVCPDLETSVHEWQRKMNLSYLAVDDVQPAWEIAQPLTIIRTYWRDRLLAARMADPSFLDWVKDVISIGEWYWLTGDNRLLRISIVSHKDGVWAGSFTPARPGEFILRATSGSGLASLLVQSIQPVLYRSS